MLLEGMEAACPAVQMLGLRPQCTSTTVFSCVCVLVEWRGDGKGVGGEGANDLRLYS